MVLLLRKLVDSYNYVFYDISDPRTDPHYIITNPILIALLLIVYYNLTKKWGPKLMEKREPFKLDKILIVYNVCQILVSAYLPLRAIYVAWIIGSYSVTCQLINQDRSPTEMELLDLTMYYYFQKISDLLDTIFFVLRKKNKQISGLHLYHHMMMVCSGFLAFRYIAGGHGVHLGIINSFVHTIMYTYYLITVISPEHKKSIWWKKYITLLQLVQFGFLILDYALVLLNPYCPYPVWICILLISQNLIMVYLFSQFYYKEYIVKKKEK